MSPFGRAHPKRVVAVLVATALVLASCGRSGVSDDAAPAEPTGSPTVAPIDKPTAAEVQAPTDEPTTAPQNVPTEEPVPPTPTPTLTPVPSDQAEELVEQLVITQHDVPVGHVVFEHGTFHSDGPGVPAGSAACRLLLENRPATPLAARQIDIEGSPHHFSAGVYVFESEMDASLSVVFSEESLEVCGPPDQSLGEYVPDEVVVVAVDLGAIAADEAIGVTYQVLFPHFGIEIEHYTVRVGNVAFEASGTHRPTVIALLEVMLAKLAGDAVPSPVALPLDTFSLVPGSAGELSTAEVMRAFAALAGVGELGLEWLDSAPDSELDRLGDSLCLADPDQLDATPLTQLEAAATPEDAWQIFGLVFSIRCPEALWAMTIDTDHQTELSPGETTLITRHLVEVDGYSYRNVTPPEILFTHRSIQDIEAEAGFDLYGGFSLHAVVVDDPSQNTTQGEVGSLGLYQFNEPVPFGFDETLARFSAQGSPIDRLEIGGIPVFVFEDLAHPHSRYRYAWVEHGIQGLIDAGERDAVERWLAAFLPIPKLGVNESAELDEALRDIDGYSYSEFDTYTVESAWILGPLGDARYSMHAVSDQDSHIAFLTLTEGEYGDLLIAWLQVGLLFSEETEIGGHRAVSLENPINPGVAGYAWEQGGISGSLTFDPADLDQARTFLEAFLSATA